MAYSKIERHLWNDEKVRSLSRDAREVWLYLLSSPHSNRFGCYVLDEMYLAADVQLPVAAVKGALAEIEGAGMVVRDSAVRLVFLPKHLKHNAPENPNVVKGALEELERLPFSATLFPALIEALRKYVKMTTESGAPAGALWVAVLEDRIANRSRNRSSNRSGNRSPDQEPTASDGEKIRAQPRCGKLSEEEADDSGLAPSPTEKPTGALVPNRSGNRSRNRSGNRMPNQEPEPEPKPEPKTTTSDSLRSSAPKSGAGKSPEPDLDVGNSVAIVPVIRPDLNQQPDRVTGGEILGAWIDQQPARPSNRDAGKFGAACKRLAAEHSAVEVAAAMVGMGQLYPHSNGQPWDPLDLERKFAKALAASQQHPDVQDARAGAEFDRILNERELVK